MSDLLNLMYCFCDWHPTDDSWRLSNLYSAQHNPLHTYTVSLTFLLKLLNTRYKNWNYSTSNFNINNTKINWQSVCMTIVFEPSRGLGSRCIYIIILRIAVLSLQHRWRDIVTTMTWDLQQRPIFTHRYTGIQVSMVARDLHVIYSCCKRLR